MPRIPRVLALIAAGGLLLAACTATPSATPTIAPSSPPVVATATPGASASVEPSASATGLVINMVTNATLGDYLTGADGRTLYFFANDTAKDVSTCTDACATKWPPLTVAAGTMPTAGAGITGTWSTFARADGTTQVSYDGHPLYYFSGDAAAGDTNGQGFNGLWFVANPAGTLPSPSASASASY